MQRVYVYDYINVDVDVYVDVLITKFLALILDRRGLTKDNLLFYSKTRPYKTIKKGFTAFDEVKSLERYQIFSR